MEFSLREDCLRYELSGKGFPLSNEVRWESLEQHTLLVEHFVTEALCAHLILINSMRWVLFIIIRIYMEQQ